MKAGSGSEHILNTVPALLCLTNDYDVNIYDIFKTVFNFM